MEASAGLHKNTADRGPRWRYYPLLDPVTAEKTSGCNSEETNPTSSPTSSNGNTPLEALLAAIVEAGPHLSDEDCRRILAIVAAQTTE